MRWLWFALFGVAGLLFISVAWLIPAHLRAVDAAVLERSGQSGSSLIESGLSFLRLEKTGPASLLLEVARAEKMPGAQRLATALRAFNELNPELLRLGGSDPILERVLPPSATPREIMPITRILLSPPAREAVGNFLQQSRRPGVQALLQHRSLTNTSFFPPVPSASGQALDSSILMAGLLLQEDRLLPPVREAIESAAADANRTGDLRNMEEVYLALLSLGKRMNWIQLTEFVRHVDSLDLLKNLASITRSRSERLPALFAAMHISRSPAEVAAYATRFGKTGLSDLQFSLASGSSGLRELLERRQPVHTAAFRSRVASLSGVRSIFSSLTDFARNTPLLAFAGKCLMLLVGGYCVAKAAELARRPLKGLEEALRIREMVWSREALFAFTLLFLFVAVGEPFLAQDVQVMSMSVRLQLPFLATAPAPSDSTTTQSSMDQYTILALVIFLVVQAVLYALCLVKLAEIRRQPIHSGLKLRLLENEENLFDAGLYCGLGGTVGSLVFLAMGIIKASLMAAYASTLFGIIFVGILKICHIRPLRRRLILESEASRA